jgi:predicted metal-binding protein
LAVKLPNCLAVKFPNCPAVKFPEFMKTRIRKARAISIDRIAV